MSRAVSLVGLGASERAGDGEPEGSEPQKNRECDTQYP